MDRLFIAPLSLFLETFVPACESDMQLSTRNVHSEGKVDNHMIGKALGLAALAATTTIPALAQDANLLPNWKSERSASGMLYTPSDLPAGKVFSVTIQPPQDLSGKDLPEWLAERADSDGRRVGKVLQKGEATKANTDAMDIYSLIQTVQGTDGDRRMAISVVSRRPDGHAVTALIISSPDKELLNQYLRDALGAVLALTKGGDNAPTTGAANRPTGGTRAKSAPEKKRRGVDDYTRAGAGPKSSEVVGIYSHMTMQMGYGGAFYPTYVPIIVLSDGTYYEDFDVPLADFDVAAARRERPKAWGKWRKQGGKFERMNSKGAWEDSKWIGPLVGGKPGERLSGKFSNLTGGGNTALGGGTAIAIVSDIYFSPDGTFKSNKLVSGSSDGEGTDVRTTVNSNNSNSGTYTLDGYTLTLKYSNGRVIKYAFAYMDPQTKRDAAYFNGSAYLKKDK